LAGIQAYPQNSSSFSSGYFGLRVWLTRASMEVGSLGSAHGVSVSIG
jgi:hypothetical protein